MGRGQNQLQANGASLLFGSRGAKYSEEYQNRLLLAQIKRDNEVYSTVRKKFRAVYPARAHSESFARRVFVLDSNLMWHPTKMKELRFHIGVDYNPNRPGEFSLMSRMEGKQAKNTVHGDYQSLEQAILEMNKLMEEAESKGFGGRREVDLIDFHVAWMAMENA